MGKYKRVVRSPLQGEKYELELSPPSARSYSVTHNGKPRRRRPLRSTGEELSSERYRMSLDISLTTWHVIEVLAWQRQVSPTMYVRDVLTAHTALVADLKQAIFREVVPRGTHVYPPPERYPGYLASIGFSPALQIQESPIPPSWRDERQEVPEAIPVPEGEMDTQGARMTGRAEIPTEPITTYPSQRKQDAI